MWDISHDDRAWLELLLTGTLAPDRGFRAPAGEDATARPLAVSATFAEEVSPGAHVILRDAEGVRLAVLQVDDRGVTDQGGWLAGRVEGLAMPAHVDYHDLEGAAL